MTSEQPAKRSLVDKILSRNSSKTTATNSNTRNTTVLIKDPKGEHTIEVTEVEETEYQSLMEQTDGMDQEETGAFLKKKGGANGEKFMHMWEWGRAGEQYKQVSVDQPGAFLAEAWKMGGLEDQRRGFA